MQVKCHQYWPETGSLGLDDITVSVIDTQELAYYTIRTFRVMKVSMFEDFFQLFTHTVVNFTCKYLT